MKRHKHHVHTRISGGWVSPYYLGVMQPVQFGGNQTGDGNDPGSDSSGGDMGMGGGDGGGTSSGT